MKKHLACFFDYVLLVCLILHTSLFVITGCSRETSRKPERVSEDTPWYSSETVTYGSFTEDDSIYPIMVEPESLVYFHESWDDVGNYNASLEVFVDDETDPHTVPLASDADIFISSTVCFEYSGELYAIISFEQHGDNYNTLYKIDLDNNTLTEAGQIVVDCDHSEITIRKAISHGDMIFLDYDYPVDNYYHCGFKVIEDDYSSIYEGDINGELTKWSVTDDGSIIAFTEEQGEAHIYRIRPDEGITTEVFLSGDIMEKYRYGVFMNDGRIYAQNWDLTLSCYDFNSDEEYIALDYNNCDANIAQVSDYTLFYADDKSIIYIKSMFYTGEQHTGNTLLKLHKCDNNPNSGKEILYAAPSMKIDTIEGEGVLYYNRHSVESYISITMDYSYYSIPRPDNVDFRKFEYDNEVARIDKLRNDIIDGIGPDILLGFGQYPILYSDEYLLDLSEVTDTLSEKDYYTNLISAFGTADGIYQIPITAEVCGMYVSEEVKTADDEPLSVDDYQMMISDSFNGKDPIGEYLGRDQYVKLLMMYNYGDFHNESGHLNIDSVLFRDLMELSASVSVKMNGNTVPNAYYLECGMFTYDLMQMIIRLDGFSMSGFPSTTSFGPMVKCSHSLAITSCAADMDAAFDYVKAMLSYDVQSTFYSCNPINKAAFEEFAERGLAYANESIETNYGIDNYYSEEIIEEYESYLRSAVVGGLTDSYTMLIVSEEIQAYYTDQKDINEVISITENRVNNMLEERGL